MIDLAKRAVLQGLSDRAQQSLISLQQGILPSAIWDRGGCTSMPRCGRLPRGTSTIGKCSSR